MGWSGSLQWIRDETIRNAGKQSGYADPSLQMELWGHVREIFQAEELAFDAVEVRIQRTLERSLRHAKESLVVALGHNPNGLSKRLLHRIPTLGVPLFNKERGPHCLLRTRDLIARPVQHDPRAENWPIRSLRRSFHRCSYRPGWFVATEGLFFLPFAQSGKKTKKKTDLGWQRREKMEPTLSWIWMKMLVVEYNKSCGK